MHDRRVDNETLGLGNQGGLFMNAMTWWDHQTGSIWSQPWGRAIQGELEGAELELLPSQLVSWETWLDLHPNTLALDVGDTRFGHTELYTGYFIGVPLDDWATAFSYAYASDRGLLNDAVGPYPIVLYLNAATQSVHVYLRQLDEQTLTFEDDGEARKDLETGSTWNLERGVALDGPLNGRVLRTVPFVSAYGRSWADFYPHSRFVEGDGASGNADVLLVRAVQSADQSWTFHVTVQHPDTGWEDYADGWDVLIPEEEVLKPDPGLRFTRLLLHPHQAEQPFTRSQSKILIPEGVTQRAVQFLLTI